MEDTGEHIVELYERHADAWVSARLRENKFYEKEWIQRFCGLIPSRGSVLDLGCGAGEPLAMHLSSAGYAVTGVDSSSSMIAMFRKRMPSQDARVLDMRTLSLGQSFHGILAWDSFFHLNQDDQRRMFPIFREHTAPRGALMFTSGPTKGEAIGRLEGEPLYHASLDPGEYRELLHCQGFDVIASVVEDQTCGGRTVWLARLR